MPTWIDPLMQAVRFASDVVGRLRGKPKPDRKARAEARAKTLEEWLAERAAERKR